MYIILFNRVEFVNYYPQLAEDGCFGIVNAKCLRIVLINCYNSCQINKIVITIITFQDKESFVKLTLTNFFCIFFCLTLLLQCRRQRSFTFLQRPVAQPLRQHLDDEGQLGVSAYDVSRSWVAAKQGVFLGVQHWVDRLCSNHLEPVQCLL